MKVVYADNTGISNTMLAFICENIMPCGILLTDKAGIFNSMPNAKLFYSDNTGISIVMFDFIYR